MYLSADAGADDTCESFLRDQVPLLDASIAGENIKLEQIKRSSNDNETVVGFKLPELNVNEAKRFDIKLGPDAPEFLTLLVEIWEETESKPGP